MMATESEEIEKFGASDVMDLNKLQLLNSHIHVRNVEGALVYALLI